MILDATQFRQLVREVSQALSSTSQGVGEVPLVDTLDGISSLPALRLLGGQESVVEAPLSLLSAVAEEGASWANEAAQDAIVAAVRADEAADLADAARARVEGVVEESVRTTAESFRQSERAREVTGKTEETRLSALATLSLLQDKIAGAVIVIAGAHAGMEELESFRKKADDVFLILAQSAEDARDTADALSVLHTRVTAAIAETSSVVEEGRRSITEAGLSTGLAMAAADVAEVRSAEAIRSAANADSAASHATEQALRAEDATVAAISATTDLRQLEITVKESEENRENSENLRNAQEQDRRTTEKFRETSETVRENSEADRVTVEKERVKKENERIAAENARNQAETARATAEQGRNSAESARVLAEKGRVSEFATLKEAAETATDKANDTASHPTIVGSDNYVYKWNPDTRSYDKTDIYVRGEGFKVSRVFTSIEEMNAYSGTDLKEGDFVLVNTGSVEDEDTAKLYTRTAEGSPEKFTFLVDMSGAIGFTGKTPQILIGTVTTIESSMPASASLAPDGTDTEGNPQYRLNFSIPKGDPLRYSDLTPEQIAELQRPATEAIDLINRTHSHIEAAEQGRVSEEEKRKSAEAGRISAEMGRAAAEELREQAEANRETSAADVISRAGIAVKSANDAAADCRAALEELGQGGGTVDTTEVVAALTTVVDTYKADLDTQVGDMTGILDAVNEDTEVTAACALLDEINGEEV